MQNNTRRTDRRGVVSVMVETTVITEESNGYREFQFREIYG